MRSFTIGKRESLQNFSGGSKEKRTPDQCHSKKRTFGPRGLNMYRAWILQNIFAVDIAGATTQVINQKNLPSSSLFQAIGHCRCCRLVNDPQDLQACQGARCLHCLAHGLQKGEGGILRSTSCTMRERNSCIFDAAQQLKMLVLIVDLNMGQR